MTDYLKNLKEGMLSTTKKVSNTDSDDTNSNDKENNLSSEESGNE
jgi:hypothetical protein